MEQIDIANPLEEYLEMIPSDRHLVIRTLDNFIRKMVPSLTPTMSAGLLGYGPYQYRYASGHEGDATVVALGALRRHYALYICAAAPDGYLPEHYSKEFPAAHITKTCIRFRKLEDLPLAALENILKHAERVGGMGAV